MHHLTINTLFESSQLNETKDGDFLGFNLNIHGCSWSIVGVPSSQCT
jgi:hypothetical protein